MKGIIYIAHGSKMPDKNTLFREFVNEIMKHRNESIQRFAFLEKADENVPLIFSEMIEAGVRECIVVPMLLFPAMHAVEDIPAQLEAVIAKYPFEIQYTIADCFGDEKEVYQVANERIQSFNADHIMIVAHGNKRFLEPDERLTKAVMLMQKDTHQHLIPAMLYGALSFEQKLSALSPKESVVIMPYFLFDGHLVRKIKRLSQPFIEKGMQITFTDTLDLDFNMVQSVLRQIEKVDAICIQ